MGNRGYGVPFSSLNADPCPGKGAFALRYTSHSSPPSTISQRLSCCNPDGPHAHKSSIQESETSLPVVSFSHISRIAQDLICPAIFPYGS